MTKLKKWELKKDPGLVDAPNSETHSPHTWEAQCTRGRPFRYEKFSFPPCSVLTGLG